MLDCGSQYQCDTRWSGGGRERDIVTLRSQPRLRRNLERHGRFFNSRSSDTQRHRRSDLSKYFGGYAATYFTYWQHATPKFNRDGATPKFNRNSYGWRLHL